MSDKLDYTIEFINKKFNIDGELSEENRDIDTHYGRDVAEYLTNNLKSHDFEVEYLEEDWGWLVLGQINPDNKFEIYIYPWGILDNKPNDERYLWRLRLRTQEKIKLLGFFPIFKSVECNALLKNVLKNMLSEEGNKFKRMEMSVAW